MGRETGNIIIPNPMNSIPFDGRVTSWSFYASGFGPLVLLVRIEKIKIKLFGKIMYVWNAYINSAYGLIIFFITANQV